MNNVIDKDNEKQFTTEQSNIIIEYLSMDIFDSYLSLYSIGLLSAYLIYQKMIDNFMAKWQVTLYPLHIFFIVKGIIAFYAIIKNEDDSIYSLKRLKLINIINIRLISNFYSLVLYCLVIICLYNLQEFLDERKDEYLFGFIYVIIAIFIWGIIYSLIRRVSFFSFNHSLNNMALNKQSSSLLGVLSSFLAPLMTTLSNMTILCSGGACTQIYISTITSLLGAFGITLSNISQYLFPITCVLLSISLFSLFIKKKKWTHKPFLLGVFSAILILLGKYNSNSKLRFAIYFGNIQMIIAAIWNAKLNKFSGLPI